MEMPVDRKALPREVPTEKAVAVVRSIALHVESAGNLEQLSTSRGVEIPATASGT